MGEEVPEVSVTVLRRREVTTWPKIGSPVINVLVTYVGAGLPPGTVSIPRAEYTLDREKVEIKADIQRRLKVSPESYKV